MLHIWHAHHNSNRLLCARNVHGKQWWDSIRFYLICNFYCSANVVLNYQSIFKGTWFAHKQNIITNHLEDEKIAFGGYLAQGEPAHLYMRVRQYSSWYTECHYRVLSASVTAVHNQSFSSLMRYNFVCIIYTHWCSNIHKLLII